MPDAREQQVTARLPPEAMREYNFDGIVGPTHNYAGLSRGNLASVEHSGQIGNPRAAALQGLEKMRFVAELGVGQAVLPPQPRPDLATLRRLGFSGSDADVLRTAASRAMPLLRLCSSASAMWTANAATVAAARDTLDGRLHITPANLCSMFHRSLEASLTSRVLCRVFSDEKYFSVHQPLPSGQQFADEGAANHTRFFTESAVLHLFAYGTSASAPALAPARYPARQSLEASQAVARLNQLPASRTAFWQQHPTGIDQGAFHADVLAVGNGNFFMLHEHAFVNHEAMLAVLAQALGETLKYRVASERELSARQAIAAYPFNSQLLSLPGGDMAVLAPLEAAESAPARRFLESIVADENPVSALHYIDLNASMKNGGGPACLRLRVPLEDEARAAITARVLWTDALHVDLKAWVLRHYRDRLSSADLADPELLREVHAALDELSAILGLGSIYDFQSA